MPTALTGCAVKVLICTFSSFQAAAQSLVASLLACTLRSSSQGGAEAGPLALLMLTQPDAAAAGAPEDEDAAACSAYLPAWLALLRASEIPTSLLRQHPRATLLRVQQQVYSELLRAVMDACRNLDLALKLPSSGSEGMGGGSAAAATPATASETAALAAIDRIGAVSASAAAAPSGGVADASSADTEDAASQWPVLSLARNVEDMQVGPESPRLSIDGVMSGLSKPLRFTSTGIQN